MSNRYDLGDVTHISREHPLRSILEEAYTLGVDFAPTTEYPVEQTFEGRLAILDLQKDTAEYKTEVIPRRKGLTQKLIEDTKCDELTADVSIDAAFYDGFMDALKNDVQEQYYKAENDYVYPLSTELDTV